MAPIMMSFGRAGFVVTLLAQPSVAALQLMQASVGLPTAHANGWGTIQGALQELQSNLGSVCLTIDPHYMVGGLANTMAMVNAAMDFALQNDVRWIMPEIRPPAHYTGDAFRFIFGEPSVCAPKEVPLYMAACPFISDPLASPADIPGMCNMSELHVYRNTEFEFSQCDQNCSAMMVVSSVVQWAAFDYSRTWPILSQMYWASQSALGDNVSSELQFPMTTAVHVRLGDVAGSGSSKEAKPLELDDIAEGLMSIIDPACLKVELHTDGEKSDEIVQNVRATWVSGGVAGVEIFDITAKELDTFHRMTHSSILIGGASGFARLAAIVGNPAIKIFVDDPDNSHPIEYLSGATTLEPMPEEAVIVSALTANKEVKAASEACKEWLGN